MVICSAMVTGIVFPTSVVFIYRKVLESYTQYRQWECQIGHQVVRFFDQQLWARHAIFSQVGKIHHHRITECIRGSQTLLFHLSLHNAFHGRPQKFETSHGLAQVKPPPRRAPGKAVPLRPAPAIEPEAPPESTRSTPQKVPQPAPKVRSTAAAPGTISAALDPPSSDSDSSNDAPEAPPEEPKKPKVSLRKPLTKKPSKVESKTVEASNKEKKVTIAAEETKTTMLGLNCNGRNPDPVPRICYAWILEKKTVKESAGNTLCVVCFLFPTSLCGVLVFGCPPASPPASSSRLLLPISNTQLTHTQLSNTTCSHTTYPHTTYSHTQRTHTQLTHTRLIHTQLIHTQLIHTQLKLTHTTYSQLAHTQLAHTQLVHAQLAHTLTHNLLTHNLFTHTTYSHTQFTHTNKKNSLTHNLFTHTHTTLSHTAWRGRRGTWWHRPSLCVALGDIHLHFTWQAWRLVTSTVTLHGRRGTYGTGLALVARLGPVWRRCRRGCLCGRRGTWRHGPPLCMAGVALGDIKVHSAFHACWSNLQTRRGSSKRCKETRDTIGLNLHSIFRTSLLRRFIFRLYCSVVINHAAKQINSVFVAVAMVSDLAVPRHTVSVSKYVSAVLFGLVGIERHSFLNRYDMHQSFLQIVFWETVF